ncbi:hypothetical protein A3F07_03230 [candidate division WWE3 bacterium RIFCSPHIGHO2_12_FULL_38_15]|uniref:Acyl carrier protein n=1 Tax=candidate division WWE3 bacterium RIFCSPHIGHO2_02_FULL_38_14 TaxID=1802620 RepID=A0A1F4V6E8_UNCKA|nr:MAG: hypothetical protein A2793_03540 [candidate division WWE3 bacterium RIFCSPHIGHO2_01_FULL_38_45]OGC48814.1 MAG: hypothetical protein A3F07_03230 [candidate division WWE3 bacterium RIFCSPHIGHO2_12_FULL_38_15]OGC52769.1 MAG: hypothetical protein A3D91_01915 [candidate division WWE3 bacterium RIFCSPHIGHO2_02_FULL_38_14]OGC53116.1 MAG: hypothetical protein A3B64_01565 [candidate division WWE3 bacterium RIFCSPLOWO2_01_FULL_37_24]HLB51955.1 phosphopantetheine-binding protein [Patescibacteria g
MTNFLNKVKKIIEEKTGIDPSEITLESYFEDDLNISEMELMEILEELDELFNLDLTSEKENLETVGDLIELLEEHLD